MVQGSSLGRQCRWWRAALVSPVSCAGTLVQEEAGTDDKRSTEKQLEGQ